MFKIKIQKLAFSMIEVMISLIILGIITAAAVPIITKKFTNKSFKISTKDNFTFGSGCESLFNEYCKYCKYTDTSSECLICTRKCENMFKDISSCSCLACDEIDANCSACTVKDNEKVCTKCNVNYYISDNKCVKCNDADASDGNECDGVYKFQCNPGSIGVFHSELSDDEQKYACDLVEAGKYQDEAGQTSAKTCAAGYYCCGDPSNECKGATDQIPCEAGTYQNEAAQSSCKACPAGTYSSEGQTSCSAFTGRNCNTFNPAGGACTECQTGYYLDNGICETCSANYYMSDTVNKICTPCAEGTSSYSDNTATSCTTEIIDPGDDPDDDPEDDPVDPGDDPEDDPDDPGDDPGVDEPGVDEPGVDEPGSGESEGSGHGGGSHGGREP